MSAAKVDVGYVGGVIDSRGHISLIGRRGVLQPRVRVTTRRVDLLSWLATRTGVEVKVDERGYERRACSEHCAQQHQHVERQSAYWSLDGARAVIVLWNVLPFLVCQTEVVHDALAQAHIYWPEMPRNEITEAMRRLGWPIPARADLPPHKYKEAS